MHIKLKNIKSNYALHNDGLTIFDSMTCTCDNRYVYAGGDVNTYTPELVNCTIGHNFFLNGKF